MSNIILIDNWSVVGPGQRLWGEVHGHPRFPKGKRVRTSTIVGYDKDADVFIIFSGSRYKLGKVSEEYEALYPDAFNRLVKVGKEKLSNA